MAIASMTIKTCMVQLSLSNLKIMILFRSHFTPRPDIFTSSLFCSLRAHSLEVFMRTPSYLLSTKHITLLLQLWCQGVHVLKEYFMVANYMWMLSEGLHLHLALVVVFVREERTMKWFFVIGWGFPVIIVAVHSLVRMYYTLDTDM